MWKIQAQESKNAFSNIPLIKRVTSRFLFHNLSVKIILQRYKIIVIFENIIS